ncbi:hypothetical protein CC78DRAFT_621153 [Lojkania enalia]|uniref:Uncharacterized protein n=1 Tax=Lojkania enalia TaxID=147567 RepID=A0A9P4K3A7_9PLEO|nr:hypothetical protein CC78DRAFT_621153 [Didymosphaeria enalia]
MAPLDPNATARSNTLPLALFGGHILLVAGLTAHLLLTVRRAARTLPPPSSTRSQEPVRRRHVTVFSVLALLALASVTTFSVLWRVISYVDWAEKGNYDTPGSLWTGWYGTGEDGVGSWRLGDWISDINLARESDALAVSTPEGFLYLAQHFSALASIAVFFGVEGKRRNFSPTTIASFILLSTFGSLGYALNLFFIALLYTPLAQHSDEYPRRDALFTPKPLVYYLPIIGSLTALRFTPHILASGADVSLVRFAYFGVLLFLAFAPQVIPLSWGREHISKAAAHRSFASAFWAPGLASLLLHWNLVATSLLWNTPPKPNFVYDLLLNTLGKREEKNRLFTAVANTAQRIKIVSSHPATSATGSDVLFTAIGLIAWAFVRNLDVTSILENSLLSFVSRNNHVEKHVVFEEKVEQVDVNPAPAPSPTKKRGRPRKNGALTNSIASSSSSASSTGTLRRSTRHRPRADYESEGEESYEPPREAAKEVTQTEADGAPDAEALVQGGETTALSLFLLIVGGLGQLVAGVLGAEVTRNASPSDL